MATLTLTAVGDDRPGLVAALAAPISDHEANWERSQMSRLAGKFAGIVEVSVATERVEALTADLSALSELGLEVRVERTDAVPAPDELRLSLDLIGDDRPGIVAEISAMLTEHGFNIEDLATDVRDAPMAGGTLFEARALLSAPATMSAEALRDGLESLADELMVDLSLTD